MELSDALKAVFIETGKSLKGSARRLFMARIVRQLGPGGQRRAERELGWSRTTIRTGTRELDRGITCADAFALRGRKRAYHPRRVAKSRPQKRSPRPTPSSSM